MDTVYTMIMLEKSFINLINVGLLLCGYILHMLFSYLKALFEDNDLNQLAVVYYYIKNPLKPSD